MPEVMEAEPAHPGALAQPTPRDLDAVIGGNARAAQTSLGIKIQILQASTLSEIEAAFAKVVELRIGGLVITGDPYFHSEQEQIAALATRYAVPTLHYIREFVVAGGLMS